MLLTGQVAALAAAVTAAGDPAAVLVASTFDGREIAGRLAVRLDSGLLADVVGLDLEDGTVVATQSVFGGAYTTRYQVTKGVPVISVRGNSIEGAAPAVDSPEVVTVDTDAWCRRHHGDRVVAGGAG